MKKLIYVALGLAIAWLLPAPALAQGIVGTWKRVAMVVEKSDGSQHDSHQNQLKSMPCFATLTYTYSTDGKVTVKAPDCGTMKAAIESANETTRWRQSGSQVSISSAEVSLPTQVYEVRVEGSRMTWIFSYADNPKTPNITNARSMTTVYQRQ